ncbi:hypothetical protein NITGR_470005 [Nitrospina gracilis 3/211]|uniref:Uncharacterized protein n=1 Tax=Nitrospina gracilis (strain 3/211) TaxID=1266370 RepID=M1YK78_NITG3|nr:hypothetical protein NITGR_470005 [Nitrospina gracilis 3/211]
MIVRSRYFEYYGEASQFLEWIFKTGNGDRPGCVLRR